jgi:AcrR family transcriptional regulator
MRQENALSSAISADQVIVEAALELMVENGFAAMSMRSLAKKVGLHAGSIYHHFPSKLDVLEEVLDSLLQQRLNDWWLRKPKRAGVLKLLDAFITFHVLHALEYSREEHLVRIELHHLQGAQLSRILEQDEAYIGELSEIIRLGVAAGLFKVPDVNFVTRSLLAMLGAAPSISTTEMSRTSIIQMLSRMARQLLWVHGVIER